MKSLAHHALMYYLRYFPVAWGKYRIFNLAWKTLTFGEYRRETVLRQAPVKVSCDLTNFLQRYLYFYGGYEDDYCAYWIKMAQNATTIFDVGTNIGLYSLLAATTNPRASIHSFEPTPEIVNAFKRNIALNGIRTINLNVAAVGSHSGQAFLNRHRHGEELFDWMNYVTDSASRSDDVPVTLTTLDEYCRQRGITRIDLLKMDIEGGEYDALTGAQQLLQSRAIDCIFLELVESHAKRSGHSTVEIKRLLLNAGYKIYLLQSKKLVPVVLETVHDGEGDNIIAFAGEVGASF